VLGIFVAYWACAETAASMRMARRAREQEKRWNRPAPPPLSAEDLIARVYLFAGLFVAACFVAAVMCRGC
jgi:hypothetical protein